MYGSLVVKQVAKLVCSFDETNLELQCEIATNIAGLQARALAKFGQELSVKIPVNDV